MEHMTDDALCQFYRISYYPVESLNDNPTPEEKGKFFVATLAGSRFDDDAFRIPLAYTEDGARALAVHYLRLDDVFHGKVDFKSCAERLVALAKHFKTPQEVFGIAIDLSGVYSEDGNEDYDSFFFQDDHSAAIVNRNTLEVEIVDTTNKQQAPFVCKYCGCPSEVDPSDQTRPADYCHEADHTNS